ncbi:unnamed protein product [Lactuca saligna]|uniref:Uncharacterized protein n=1 Tax=Lactuca saligna TaxID=75948 RepID=A0AA35YDF9_LACSI|nr:unnamed protein product [Lactuca saligna]
MVKNAQEELLQWYAENAKNNPMIIHADETCAAGIIQAIGHFKLGPNTSPRDLPLPDLFKFDDFEPAYEVVKFYLFLESCDIENPEQYLENLKAVCFSPFGVEQSLHEVIGKLEQCYGEKKGTKIRIWVDQVFPSRLDSNTWLVKFKKLEKSGEEQMCCFTTVILSSKDVKLSQGLTWIDLLAEISRSPRILSEVDAAMKTKRMKNDVDKYLKTRPQGTSFLSKLKQKLLISPSNPAVAGKNATRTIHGEQYFTGDLLGGSLRQKGTTSF